MSRALPALLLLAALPARAAELSTPSATQLSGPRASAMGDAHRGVASTNEAILFNPAGLAQREKYEIDAGYSFNRGTELSRFDASIADSRTSRLAAGVWYSHLSGTGADGYASGHVGMLALALPFSDVGAIGATVKYLNFEARERTNAVTADAGLFFQLGDWVRLGGTVSNFVDVESEQAPFSLGGGVSVGTDDTFRAAFDVAADLSNSEATPLTISAGAEYLLLGAVPLRAGFKRLDATERNYVSFGTGWLAPEGGLEAAYVQNLTEGEAEDRLFSATLKIFL